MKRFRRAHAFLWTLLSAAAISSCESIGEGSGGVGAWSKRLGGEDVATETEFALVLSGGAATSYEALDWMADKAGGGDFIELCFSPPDDPWRELYARGKFNSVTSIAVGSREEANSDDVVEALRSAEAVYIAGGDQYDYYQAWNETRLEATLEWLATEKKVPIGGNSAGMASLGHWVYTAESGSARSEKALLDPYSEDVTIRGDFLDLPIGASLIADTHWSERNRMGRTIAFLARLLVDGVLAPCDAYAIACDEGAAVCIDGYLRATVFGALDDYDDYAFVLVPARMPDRCEPGLPLEWRGGIVAYRLPGWPDGRTTFNLAALRDAAHEGTERFTLDVAGGTVTPDIQMPDVD